MGSFNTFLAEYRAGTARSEANLIELVYRDLRRMASRHLAGQRMSTLNTTVLINESYLRLVSPAARHVESKDHFFCLASRIMRQIIVDHARARLSANKIVDPHTDAADIDSPHSHEERHVLKVNEALNDLEKINERQARVVECKFFSGMTEEETARALGMSVRSVQRDWERAREWLHDHMSE